MQGEVATARAEANERKIRAKEADEMAKLEKMKRESEEKLRLDATEREKKVNKHTLSLARSHARTQRTHIHTQTDMLTLCCACKLFFFFLLRKHLITMFFQLHRYISSGWMSMKCAKRPK